MIDQILLFLFVFLFGEILVNFTFFRYLKNYFDKELAEKEEQHKDKLFLGFHLSTFKGVFERFIIFICLILNFNLILTVFGALKIGTRLDRSNKIQNDYFLIGNFASILFSIIYYYIYNHLLKTI